MISFAVVDGHSYSFLFDATHSRFFCLSEQDFRLTSSEDHRSTKGLLLRWTISLSWMFSIIQYLASGTKI
jgi:hypothetical protein